MDLKYLNTFRAIVNEGSFSEAARKLNYTQSTITFQIGQLEQELSVRLFDKIGRKMVLTKAGEQLIPYVDEVLQSVDRLQTFQNNLSQYQGNLHIGVGETLLCYLLPDKLKTFHQSAPNVQLYLQSLNCYEIHDKVLNGSLDLGIFYEDIGGISESLITRPLGTFELVLVASPETASQFPDFVTPGREIPLPFIINETNCIFRQIFERYLREKSLLLDHTIELWSIPTIKNLVKNNVGISYLPRFAVQEELNCGQLVTIPTDLDGTAITAVCACHKNKWLSPPMELFSRLCCSEKERHW